MLKPNETLNSPNQTPEAKKSAICFGIFEFLSPKISVIFDPKKSSIEKIIENEEYGASHKIETKHEIKNLDCAETFDRIKQLLEDIYSKMTENRTANYKIRAKFQTE